MAKSISTGSAPTCRHANRERVGAKGRPRRAERRRRSHPGAGRPAEDLGYKAAPRRRLRILADATDMIPLPDRHETYPELLGLTDCEVEGYRRGILPKASLGTEQRRCPVLTQDLRFRRRANHPLVNELHVLRNAQHAMRVMAGEIGAYQMPRNVVRDSVRSTRAGKDRLREVLEVSGGKQPDNRPCVLLTGADVGRSTTAPSVRRVPCKLPARHVKRANTPARYDTAWAEGTHLRQPLRPRQAVQPARRILR